MSYFNDHVSPSQTYNSNQIYSSIISPSSKRSPRLYMDSTSISLTSKKHTKKTLEIEKNLRQLEDIIDYLSNSSTSSYITSTISNHRKQYNNYRRKLIKHMTWSKLPKDELEDLSHDIKRLIYDLSKFVYKDIYDYN